MRYRPEIDGLRAVAVIPVILFHAGFQLFGGGFVGVDIFFVISGYLITTILLEDLEAGQFSILNFYERRARRILPALFLVLALCLPFAWLWLMPDDLSEFSQSVMAVVGFVSNLFFWQTSDYFDTATELKPLLHTWSLAVEEQFYVLFPLFLVCVWRWKRTSVVTLLAIVSLLSLALAQYSASTHPVAAFFLLPTRGWELVMGALIAFYLKDKDRNDWPLVLNQVLSLVGLGLVAFGVLALDKDSPFPSVYALAPTMGAGLIILCALPETFVGRLLGSRVCVGVGLVSYSAYLWHQPLLSFVRHRSLTEPNNGVLMGLVVLTFGLAYLTWRYIETPFRQKTIVPKQWLWRFSLVSAVVIVFFAGSLQFAASDSYSNLRKDMERLYRVDTCMFSVKQTFETLLQNQCDLPPTSSVQVHLEQPRPSKRYVLYGDSVAAHLYPGLLSLSGKIDIIQLTGGSCSAIPSRKDNRCRDFYNWFVGEYVPNDHSDGVLVSSRWLREYEQLGDKEFRALLNDLFEKLKGHRVIVYSQAASLSTDIHRYVYKLETFAFGLPEHLEAHANNLETVNAVLREESSKFGFEFIDVSQVFCSKDKCLVAKDDVVYFWDTIHLTLTGSVLLVNRTSRFLTGMPAELPHLGETESSNGSVPYTKATMVRSLDGTIRSWDKEAANLYGWQPRDIQGMTSHQVLGTVFPIPLEVINEVLRLNGHWEGQLIHKRRDGSTVTVLSHWELQKNLQSKDRSATVIEINSPSASRNLADKST